MQHNVGPVFHRPAQIRGRKGGINDQRQPMGPSYVGQSRQVGHRPRRVTDDLGIHESGAVIYSCRKSFRIVTINKAGLNTKPTQGHIKHGVGAAVQA